MKKFQNRNVEGAIMSLYSFFHSSFSNIILVPSVKRSLMKGSKNKNKMKHTYCVVVIPSIVRKICINCGPTLKEL